MMINCEKTSELISKKLDSKLTFREKISLKFHTMMCSVCALFEEEAKTLSKTIEHEQKVNASAKTMSKESKDHLKELLNS